MKAALKYPVFYLAPAEHMVYVFWREENVTTRRLLAEADGWAGQDRRLRTALYDPPLLGDRPRRALWSHRPD